jgi:hypothetical protein
MGIIALIFGGGFLAAAVASMRSQVALLTEVRRREHPRAFLALVSLYWVLGLTGIGVGIVALLGGFWA